MHGRQSQPGSLASAGRPEPRPPPLVDTTAAGDTPGWSAKDSVGSLRIQEEEFGPLKGRPSAAVAATLQRAPSWIKAQPRMLGFGRRQLCIASVKSVEIALSPLPANPGRAATKAAAGGADGSTGSGSQADAAPVPAPVKLISTWASTPSVFPSIQRDQATLAEPGVVNVIVVPHATGPINDTVYVETSQGVVTVRVGGSGTHS